MRHFGDITGAVRLISATLAILLCGLAGSSRAGADTPEQHAIEEIRSAALAVEGEASHPLPLASGWMDGRDPMGFGPDYQFAQIRAGQYVLPWLGVYIAPKPGATGDDYPSPGDALYFEPAIRYLAQHHLPLCLVTTEWEGLMAQKEGDTVRLVPLSPFDPIAPFASVGHAWAQHPILRRLQKLYPDPPLVLIVQDSEYPRLHASDLGAGWTGTADAAVMPRRRAISDAWIEKYRTMFRAFRQSLDSPAWRERSVVVGFDQFLTSAMGRWSGWTNDTLYVPGRTEPWPEAWDGASVSYYLHDFFPDADFRVWSPQIEAMNWVAELQAVRRHKPAYWFELSTWDGWEPGQTSDKAKFWASLGQTFTPQRYEGMIQFGMWLLRPRVVREFRNPEHDRIRFGPYFEAILAAVARVHDNPDLREFWREGRLLENRAAQHPYQEAVPAALASRPRWFLLDSPQLPPRPWDLSTSLNVFALALERGRAPHRQWLVYAFSPLHDETELEVTIPGGPVTHVRATPSGAFTIVQEGQSAGRLVYGKN